MKIVAIKDKLEGIKSIQLVKTSEGFIRETKNFLKNAIEQKQNNWLIINAGDLEICEIGTVDENSGKIIETDFKVITSILDIIKEITPIKIEEKKEDKSNAQESGKI